MANHRRHRRLRRPRRRIVLAAVSTALVALVGLAVPALARDTATTPNVLPGLARATDLGVAPAATEMRLVLSLDRPDPAGEQAALDAAHDPASAQFGRSLSPDQFAARFGVPAERVAAATAWLSSGGLHVTSVSIARDQIAVTGTTDAVGRLFGTPMHTFSMPAASPAITRTATPTAGVPDGRFVANTTAPSVPADLGVANVVGLNTLQRMHTPNDPRTRQTGCDGTTCTGGTTPADLWSVYEQPPAVTGQGQRVAIFGAGATDGVIRDLRAFGRRFGLRDVPVAVHHPVGDTDLRDDSDHTEWNIDTQASRGMAPGLQGLDLYFGETLDDADVAKMFSTYTDDEHAPRQASASFGECESVPVVSQVAGLPALNPDLPVSQGLGNHLDASLTAITRQAALEGRTIFSSAGDTGSSCPVVSLPEVGAGNGLLNQAVPITNSPASLPDVVGVGGTVLYTDSHGRRTREYGWTFGGGGSALVTPAPDYQRGTPGLTIPCVTDPGSVCRGVPDVSAQSGDVTGNGYDIVTDGKLIDGGGGGTSLSSPLWAGMWARVQSASTEPGGLGFANYALYRVGKDPGSYARDFHDITPTDVASGLPSTNGLYPSLPGWDYQTGWGVPRVAGLVCDVARRC